MIIRDESALNIYSLFQDLIHLWQKVGNGQTGKMCKNLNIAPQRSPETTLITICKDEETEKELRLMVRFTHSKSLYIQECNDLWSLILIDINVEVVKKPRGNISWVKGWPFIWCAHWSIYLFIYFRRWWIFGLCVYSKREKICSQAFLSCCLLMSMTWEEKIIQPSTLTKERS